MLRTLFAASATTSALPFAASVTFTAKILLTRLVSPPDVLTAAPPKFALLEPLNVAVFATTVQWFGAFPVRFAGKNAENENDN